MKKKIIIMLDGQLYVLLVLVRGQGNVRRAAALKGPMTYAKALENNGQSNNLRGCNCRAKNWAQIRFVLWGRDLGQEAD